MTKRVLPIFLLVVFATALTGFGIKNQLDSVIAEKETPALYERHSPNAELERVQPAIDTVPSLLQKKLIAQTVSSAVVFNNAINRRSVVVIRSSSLLIKQYLFLLHPFHSFW